MALTIQQIQDNITAKNDAREIINQIADYLQANPSGGGGASSFDPSKRFELYEDFVCENFNDGSSNPKFGLYRWEMLTNGSSQYGSEDGLLDAPGVIILQGIDGYCSISVSGTDGTSLFLCRQPNLSIKFRIRNENAPSADGNVRFGLHLSSTMNGDNDNSIYFRAIGIGNYEAVCNTDGTETARDTGIAQNTLQWTTFEILSNNDATSIGFYIANTLVATITTNIPTDPDGLYPIFETQGVANAYHSNYQIDYIYASITGLNR